MKRIAWKWVLVFAAGGTLLGVATLFGVTHGFEPFLWLLFNLALAYVLSQRLHERLFVHGALAGLGAVAANSALRLLFFPVYLANNFPPEDLARLQANGHDPRVFFALGIPVTLIFGAMFAGTLTWLAGKLRQRVQSQRDAVAEASDKS